MKLPKQHRLETERIVREFSQTDEGKKDFAKWILEEGFFPEPYVTPPCFKIENFELSDSKLETKDYTDKNWTSYDFARISFPKTGLVQRVFGIIHPKRYHDIVWELMKNWDDLLNILFDPENEIYSYSFPIALSKDNKDKLRSGRMIYEFLEMAEKDLVAEAYSYKKLAKVDITNFYNSVYTHTISWAWCGDRIKGLSDSGAYNYCGTRLDKLFQYSNDKRTIGLPVGPVLSDIVVELILAERDKVITKRLRDAGVDFLATRFKDDYRILTQTDSDCEFIIKTIIDVLHDFNLQVNESKTKIVSLPEGLYRVHAIKYEPYSIRDNYEVVPFKVFEHTLLKSIEIHREHLGTSLLEKFLSELVDNDKSLEIHKRIKVAFANEKIPVEKENYEKVKKKNIKKAISLLLMLKNESPKSLAKVLSIIECIYLDPDNLWLKEEGYLFDILLKEVGNAIIKKSAFELTWYIYFVHRHNVEIDILRLIKDLKKSGKINATQSQLEILKNPFIATLRNKMNKNGDWINLFGDNDIQISMFKKPETLVDTYLIDYLNVFDRAEQENE